jgi:CMP-N,N'-diacetyllegionaminic acid synthase
MSEYKRPILGIIPARGGSKRIPGKNLVDLCGRPLIQYTIEAAQASGKIDRVILSTDDKSIAEVGRRLGVDVPFIRPANIAEDLTDMPVVIRHALQWVAAEERDYASVAILQPTSPLRRSSDIDAAIEAYLETDANSLVGVCAPREDPFDLLVPVGEKARFLIPENKHEDYPQFHFLSGAIYLILAELVLEKGISYEENMAMCEMDWISSFDVDTPQDLEIATILMRNRLQGLKNKD